MSADTLTMKYENELSATSSWDIIVADSKVYLQGLELACFDANTCKKLWARSNEDGSNGVRMLLVDGKLYYGTGGLGAKVFAVDASTGSEFWRTSSISNCGMMSLYNDVIYYNSGGDGKMHCVEASTGRVLGEFDAPGFKKDSGDFFTQGLSIDPATGRIYTASYLSALCFEPLQ